MKIQNIMSKNIISADVTDSISNVAVLMSNHDIGFIPICKNKKVIGVITDRDIVIRAIKENADLSSDVSKYITKKVISVNINSDVEEALNIMKEKKIKRILVEEDGKIIGILSLSDIANSEVDPLLIVGAIKEIFSVDNKKEDYHL